jgi:hypothetical protein
MPIFVPLTMFRDVPDRVRCGSSLEVGAPIAAATDREAHYIKSVAELVDNTGTVVGWIYLAETVSHQTEEYVQANPSMNSADLRQLGLRWINPNRLSTYAPLSQSLPSNLRARVCTESVHS